jgi:hypothetical protein
MNDFSFVILFTSLTHKKDACYKRCLLYWSLCAIF